jgi:uncharacterized damage-inducible protein DinB
MQADEKLELLGSLAEGRQALMDAVAGLTEEQAAHSPGEGRWSVRDCVEHLALAEEYLYGRLLEGRTVDDTGINPRREARIAERAADRSRPVTAPDAARPAGRYATLAAALQAFLDIRERTVRYVESCDEDLRAKLTTHPILGAANCHETLLMIALHPKRHAAQIREIRAGRTTSSDSPA